MNLNPTPTASGEIQIVGDSESPALPPAGALVPAWYGAAAQLLGAPWDSTWRAKVSDCQRQAGNSRGSSITFH